MAKIKNLTLDYQLPELSRIFTPASDPLHSNGPTIPVFTQVVMQLRSQKIPDELHINIELTESNCNEEQISRAQDTWQRSVADFAQIEKLRLAELVITRRRFLLKGLLILFSCLAIGNLLGSPDRGLLKTLSESLVIGGWVAVWVPLERIFYTGWPIHKEIMLLETMAKAQLNIRVC